MANQGYSVTDSDQPHGQKIIQAGGFAMLTAEVEHELPTAVPSRKPIASAPPIAHTTSTPIHRSPNGPMSCRPSRPSPSITKGNAVPSLKPASPVREKRRGS